MCARLLFATKILLIVLSLGILASKEAGFGANPDRRIRVWKVYLIGIVVTCFAEKDAQYKSKFNVHGTVHR